MPLNEISLRHLPDLSDASFSFLIPTDDDDLLRGDATDFFRGAQEASLLLGDHSSRSSPAPPSAQAKPLLPTTKANLHAPPALHATKPSTASRPPPAAVSEESVPITLSTDGAPTKSKSTTRAVPPAPVPQPVRVKAGPRTAPAPHPARAPAAPDAGADTDSAARLMAYAQQWQTMLPASADEGPMPLHPDAATKPKRTRAVPVPVPPAPSSTAPAPVSASVSASPATAPPTPVSNPTTKADDPVMFCDASNSITRVLPLASLPPATDANAAAPSFVPPTRAGTIVPRVVLGAGKRGRTRADPGPAPARSVASSESTSATATGTATVTVPRVSPSVPVTAPVALSTKARPKTTEILRAERQKLKTKTVGEKKPKVGGDGDTKKQNPDDSAAYATRNARVESNEREAEGADVDIEMQAPADVANAHMEMRVDDAHIAEYKHEDTGDGTMAPDALVPRASPPRDDGPLTLSQLSPRKQAALDDARMPVAVRMDIATAGKNPRGTKRRLEAPLGGEGDRDGEE
ncbi:hypothetical protein B0H15DRAFT_1027503, partial [Mycena belliarum]